MIMLSSEQVLADQWRGSWSSLRGGAVGRCAKQFDDYSLQAVCLKNEQTGHAKMQGDFGLPADAAEKAKLRCEAQFEDFSLQAVCMENESKGYKAVYGDGADDSNSARPKALGKRAGNTKKLSAAETRSLQLEAVTVMRDSVTSLRSYIESFRGRGEDAAPTSKYPAKAVGKYFGGVERIQRVLSCCSAQVDSGLAKLIKPEAPDLFRKNFGNSDDIVGEAKSEGPNFLGPMDLWLQLTKMEIDGAAERLSTK